MAKHNGKKKSRSTTAPVVPSESTDGKMGIKGVFLEWKNEGQRQAVEAMDAHALTFIHGWPGTGKTHIAIARGVQKLLDGTYQRLYLTRPVTEAGEHLGFLPGSYNDKIAPYLYPIMEILNDMLGKETVKEFIESETIKILPLAYMRGTTLKNAFVVADECQNCSVQQMRMLLTRIGENCKMVITGDTEQSDLYLRFNDKNGLEDCIDRLKTIEEIAFIELTQESCVRSPLVSKIDSMYRRKD